MQTKDVNHTTYSLTVKKVVQETHDARSIYFDTSSYKNVFNYKPGQHITLHFIINGKKVSRAYSLFTAPHEGDFAITIKRVKGGLVSNHINDNVKAGDILKVSPPKGIFTLKEHANNAKAYYFFGGGSGITPLLSIIKTILKEKENSNIYFLYGNRNHESIIHNKVLDHLKTAYANRFHVEHELESEGGYFGKGFFSHLLQTKTGWIDRRRILYFLKDNPSHLPAEYFICGPIGMINNVEDILTELIVDPENVHTERFGSNLKSASLDASDITVNRSELTFQKDGTKKIISIKGDKSLFESLTQKGEDIPHSCLSGSCATCACRIIKGKVKMKQNYGLNETQLTDGFILSCQAIPQTKAIEIDFDIN